MDGVSEKCIELTYSKKDGELEPGRYLVMLETYEPKVRFHIKVNVLCRADDLEDGCERFTGNGPYEKVLTYLSWQELERVWRNADGEPDIRIHMP